MFLQPVEIGFAAAFRFPSSFFGNNTFFCKLVDQRHRGGEANIETAANIGIGSVPIQKKMFDDLDLLQILLALYVAYFGDFFLRG